MSDTVRRGTKNLLRDINNSRVLQILQARAPISRADIAKLAELPPPTITSIVNGFIRIGLVEESAADVASIGRPPIMLRLNERAAFAVGVKLRSEGMTVAVTGLAGALVSHVDCRLDTMEPMSVLEQVAIQVKKAVNQAKVPSLAVLGLGIGMPGLIDHVQGKCRISPLLGWQEVDVRRQLEQRLEMPVYVDNDVNMLTAAELAFGVGREASDFLTVSIGRGIGLGIVIRGEIYRGAFGGAGELGHTKVESSFVCTCGGVGCLEAAASDVAIEAQVATLLDRAHISVQEAADLASSGDTRVQAVFDRAGRLLGQSVGNLFNLINPQLVVISGEGTQAGPVRIDPILSAVQEAAFSLLGSDTRVVVQRWGDEAWARGAASIVVHEMIKAPIYESASRGPLTRLLDRGNGQNGNGW